jgi:hypothetical protein
MTDRSALSAGLVPMIIVFVAAILRIPGLFTDFWLDEIWTLKIVLGMDSAWDVFTEVRHSNNHHLNTLFFYALGDLQTWPLYRIHSLLAGIGSVALAFRIGSRHGRAEALAASVLCGASYLLIHFSSEARGYAMVVFFGLAAFSLLEGFPDDRRLRRPALFWLTSCLGFLSHLMYLHVFVATGAWALLSIWRRREDAAAATADAVRWLAVPAVFLAAFYWFDIRLTKIGDGPELEAGAVFLRALSYALGGPPSGPIAVLFAVATLFCFGGSVLWWQRQGRDGWLFLAVVVFVSPAITFLAFRPDVFFVRYFLLSTAFGLVALAGPLSWAATRGGAWRTGAALLLAAVVIGNGLDLARFYRYGRGDYLSTVRLIAEQATSGLPEVGGDHRFRTHNVIRFYNRYVPVDRRLVYREQAEHPEWLLLHRIGELGEVAEAVARDDVTYELVRVARYSDLSGWHWLVYRLR